MDNIFDIFDELRKVLPKHEKVRAPVQYREEFRDLGQALQGYDKCVSIEMKAAEDPSQALFQIETALKAGQQLM